MSIENSILLATKPQSKNQCRARRSKERSPLAVRHYHQIGCRSPRLRKQLEGVWGLSWRPGGRSGSFLNNLYRPIGSALAMVQVSTMIDERRERIRLLGFAGQVRASDASVHYDTEGVKLDHNFSYRPWAGAKGNILDPRDDRQGGNASWVRLALNVDRARLYAVEHHHKLPVVPQLPRYFFRVASPEAIPMEVTPALLERALDHVTSSPDRSPVEDRLAGLVGADPKKLRRQKEAHWASLDAEARDSMLRKSWRDAFVAPDASGNNTSSWLIEHVFLTDVFGTLGLFEYFGDLVGATIYNPARHLIRSVPRDNPARQIAAKMGLDLDGLLVTVVEKEFTEPDAFSAAAATIMEIAEAMRPILPVGTAFTDNDLISGVMNPDQPLESNVTRLTDVWQDATIVRMMRQALGESSEACTDADLLEAASNPQQPLLARGLCRIQVLRRDRHMPLPEGLTFSPQVLGREGVHAAFWRESTGRWKEQHAAG